jgi:hypothetical protein
MRASRINESTTCTPEIRTAGSYACFWPCLLIPSEISLAKGDLDWSTGTMQQRINILVVDLGTQDFGRWIVGFELPVVRGQIVEAPTLVTQLLPVIQILPRSHGEHIVVDGRRPTEHLPTYPAMYSPNCSILNGQSARLAYLNYSDIPEEQSCTANRTPAYPKAERKGSGHQSMGHQAGFLQPQ